MTSPAFDSVAHAFLESFMEKYDAAWKAKPGDAVAALCVDDVSWSDPVGAEYSVVDTCHARTAAPTHEHYFETEAAKFIDSFDEIFRTEGLEILKTPVRTPVANAFANAGSAPSAETSSTAPSSGTNTSSNDWSSTTSTTTDASQVARVMFLCWETSWR